MTAFLQIEKTVFDDTLQDANFINYGVIFEQKQ